MPREATTILDVTDFEERSERLAPPLPLSSGRVLSYIGDLGERGSASSLPGYSANRGERLGVVSSGGFEYRL